MRLIVIYNPSVLLRNPPPFTQGRLLRDVALHIAYKKGF